jgi:hypothetical protein
MAERYKTSPAEILRIDDPYWAYCLNEAVYIFMAHVEDVLYQSVRLIKDPEQRVAVQTDMLRRLLADEEPEGEAATSENGETAPKAPPAPRKGRFKDPADLFH